MRALLIACSAAAYERMLELKEKWEKQEPETELICKVKCAALPKLSEKQSLSECVGEWFLKVDAIVFLCAAGIAVRSIAPWIVHKGTDPAVIVMDETFRYCISLLSGHWGGANALAHKLSRMTGALPVITTATDREEKFAVDLFARKNGLILTDWKLAKKISARILEGKRIALYSELMLEGKTPAELCIKEEGICRSAGEREVGGPPQEEKPDDTAFEGQPGIAVSCRSAAQHLFEETLLLIPRIVVAGVGCKKGTSEEEIETAIGRCLEETGICPKALCAVASIDLKREEAGLVSWCGKRGLPFLTYPAQRLRREEGDFTKSAFVESVTGVSNVCERSAAAAVRDLEDAEKVPFSGGEGRGAFAPGTFDEPGIKKAPGSGSLISRKKAYGGVTVALALKKGSVRF